MRVLHFLHHGWLNCRCQRAIQSCVNMGLENALFVNQAAWEKGDFWIPDADQVPISTYVSDWHWFFLYPSPKKDHFGLLKAFDTLDCDVVHANDLWAARYSYSLGLPTVYDDWEYWYEYMDVARPSRGILGKFSTFIRKSNAKQEVLQLIENVPTIVTNKNVAAKYHALGGENVRVVPNVPLKFEHDYAFQVPVEKQSFGIVYIGDLSDEVWSLRDARDIVYCSFRDQIYQFSGETRLVSHLDLLRKVREFTFNLFWWKPHPLHKYYLNNKAFIASVLGIPTLISRSLTANIDLLGEYAIPIRHPAEIYHAVKNYEPRELFLREDHFWEFYQEGLREAYKEAIN